MEKEWENDIFWPFLYCLWLIWIQASSNLRVSGSLVFLRPKEQFFRGGRQQLSLCQGLLGPSSRTPLLFQTLEETEHEVSQWNDG